ncbi:MAG: zinc-ribbon domain-containing protein [Thermoplasmata archaeon]
MSVCQHCGELAPEGALFCVKCGFTLPQAGVAGVGGQAPSPPAPVGLWVSGSSAGGSPVAPPLTPGAPPPPAPASRPLVTPPPVPPSSAYWPPPPNGKYCVRCGTLIARPAVYCPVCQQPQPP